jgi:hypothetical protein
MLRNKLVRSDGSIIDSSVIISCEFTEEVNSTTNLVVGDVTASELTVEILSTNPIQQDEVLTYSIIEDGVETKIGVFKAEKPTIATRTSMRFSAYDNIIKTEKLFSDWLRANRGLFPMTLLSLVEYACSHCGVVLVTTDFPHADLQVGAFYADDLTCRQILSWAAAIAGRFVRANANGELEFAWYVAANTTVAPAASNVEALVDVRDDGAGNVSIVSKNISVMDDGVGNITLLPGDLSVTTDESGIAFASVATAIPFLRDKLSYESYTTDLIERVQINHSEDDVGVIYPADVAGNCFTISENMILGTVDRDDVMQVAASLYSHLKDITYVPLSVTVPRTIFVRAGDIVSVTDASGNTFESYVMKMSVTPNGTTLTSTGDKSYGSNAAVSSEKYSNLTGKILSISKSVDGLVVKNEALDGKVSGLEVNIGGLKTYVEETFVSGDSFEKYKSEVTQTSKDITARFENVESDIRETKAHIKSGLLYHNEDGTPMYGIEIGQRTETGGVETFDKYAQFTSEKLAFFDQSGNEVTQIGDKKMSITNVEITGSANRTDGEYGTFKQGGFVDITLADSSIVTKWIGGS